MFKTPSYLCDRCVYHFVGGQVCGDCNRGSKFVERVRFLKEGNETMYNQMYVSAARANGKSNMDLENYLKYLTSDCKSIEPLRQINLPEIKKVVFNDPATIVFWSDGTKTVVKCGENDEYDPEKGLAMAIAKKALGNQGNYYETFKKWLPEKVEEKPAKNARWKIWFNVYRADGSILPCCYPTDYASKSSARRAANRVFSDRKEGRDWRVGQTDPWVENDKL